ncbi:MAG: hypothetical protein EHM72_13090 [Calditrichaeota bacterium]|nr:MAG: hypothetical protein EHM72_13090 [Calditrichota bacterium]
MKKMILLLVFVLALSTTCGIFESEKKDDPATINQNFSHFAKSHYFEITNTAGNAANPPQIMISSTSSDTLIFHKQYIDVCKAAIYSIEQIVATGRANMIYVDGTWRHGVLTAGCDAYFPPLLLPPFGQHEETIRPFLSAGDYLLTIEYSQKIFTPPQERKTVSVFCQVK